MLTFHNCNFTSLFSQFLWETCKFVWDLHIEVLSEIKQIPVWIFKALIKQESENRYVEASLSYLIEGPLIGSLRLTVLE